MIFIFLLLAKISLTFFLVLISYLVWSYPWQILFCSWICYMPNLPQLHLKQAPYFQIISLVGTSWFTFLIFPHIHCRSKFIKKLSKSVDELLVTLVDLNIVCVKLKGNNKSIKATLSSLGSRKLTLILPHKINLENLNFNWMCDRMSSRHLIKILNVLCKANYIWLMSPFFTKTPSSPVLLQRHYIFWCTIVNTFSI